ncbi:helix-turn-helix domain-containing protein [Nocardia mangyaensis]|uniref:helix-turn-helix domain-containing protein n=1 Tax=Nocardia mangyaensis TaxID=2213200 RepID=UPI002676F9A8|nr:helix-turn-helix domain-containing protein [Nocardia mangyaensis]MDO3651187.1 helix-turn-helix domain-containing protein [Nocardia mangyaensis]
MSSDKAESADASPPTQRVVSVLELLADADEPQTAAQIADHLDLSRSTVGNVLSALRARAWVSRSGDLTYELGPAFLRTAERERGKLGGDPSLRTVLQGLAQEVDCGVALIVLDGAEIRFTDVVENRGRVPAGISVGTRLPLIPPAAATVIAHADEATRRAWLMAADPADRRKYEQLLADVHVFGVAVWGVDSRSVATLDVLADIVEYLAHDPVSRGLRERVLALLGEISGAAYRPSELDTEAALPISYVSAPVLGPGGVPLAELIVGPMHAAVTRGERDRCLSAVAAAATVIPGLR